MKYYQKLSAEQRAEVDAAVHDAYVCEDGTIRTHAEADEEFARILRDARQAQRNWPEMLLEEWMSEGRRQFLKSRYKNSEIFTYLHKGRKRSRTLRRGVQRRNDEGKQEWIQGELGFWTARDLENAIKQCSNRIEEERANIAMYRALINLLNSTGEFTVQAALEAKETSLEDYLAEVDAA